jgi:hypothetical protein
MSTPREVLARAREIQAPLGAWTVGKHARDADFVPVAPEDEEACRFCLLGAVRRARHELGATYTDAARAIRWLAAVIGVPSGSATWAVMRYSDDHTQPEVLALLDLALLGPDPADAGPRVLSHAERMDLCEPTSW